MSACPAPSSDLQQPLQRAKKLGQASHPATGATVVKEGKQELVWKSFAFSYTLVWAPCPADKWVTPSQCPELCWQRGKFCALPHHRKQSPRCPQCQPVNCDQNIWRLLMCNELGSLSQVPRWRVKIGTHHSCLCHQGGTIQPSAFDMGNSPPFNLFN